MYNPKFTITNKMLKDIGMVEACREVVNTAPMVPSWEARFREEAVIRTVHFGTHLEGNELNYTEAAKVINGVEIKARSRDVQEVMNYRNVLKLIEEIGLSANQGATVTLTEPTIKRLHKLTVEKLMTKDQCGFYRSTQVVVRNSATGEITFRPPPAVEVPYLIESFVSWFNSEKAKDLHPVIKAGITHYELVRIHPFVDGNGRVARACATMVLYILGYDIKRFFALEEHYDRDATRYYDALASVNKSGELTDWLEYFSEGLAIELNRIKEKVQRISLDVRMRRKKGQIALNERQMKILEYIQSIGFISNQAYQEIFPMISEDTVLRDIQQLVKMKILKKEGSTKKARYVIKN